jgi:hypothetical protein
MYSSLFVVVESMYDSLACSLCSRSWDFVHRQMQELKSVCAEKPATWKELLIHRRWKLPLESVEDNLRTSILIVRIFLCFFVLQSSPRSLL